MVSDNWNRSKGMRGRRQLFDDGTLQNCAVRSRHGKRGVLIRWDACIAMVIELE